MLISVTPSRTDLNHTISATSSASQPRPLVQVAAVLAFAVVLAVVAFAVVLKRRALTRRAIPRTLTRSALRLAGSAHFCSR